MGALQVLNTETILDVRWHTHSMEKIAAVESLSVTVQSGPGYQGKNRDGKQGRTRQH